MAIYPRDSLQRSDLDLFAKKVGIVVLFAIALALLWAARDVLIIIFIAAVLAAGISPAVHRVRVWARYRLHRNIARGTAVLIVYLPFLVLTILLMIFIVPPLIGDLRALAAQFPAMLERNVIAPLERSFPGVGESWRGGIVLPRARVFFYVRSAATAIASFIAVLFLVGYMLVDVHQLTNLVLLFYPPEVRAERRATMSRMAWRMSSWLSGQLILSAIVGVVTFIGLLALRVPYALPLALFAAIGQMVPIIGPIIATIPALVVAVLQSQWQFWAVLIMTVLLLKIVNFLIAPRVMARKVSISPLAVFIAFMIGAALLGIVGAIMAIPVAAIAQVAFEEAFVEPRERRHDLARAGTLTNRRL